MKAKTVEREEAIRLRVEERLSLPEISSRLGVSKGSVSNWLRSYPLTPEERRARQSMNGKASAAVRRARRVREESSLHKLLDGASVSRHSKAKIAEAAVLLRMTLLGYSIYGSPFDGDKLDWVADTGKRLVKLQVKWARTGKYGAPYINLRCSNGRRQSRHYQEGEFDFIVAYDLYTDTCYVWSWEDVKGLGTKACEDSAAEKWEKIRV